MMRSVFKFSIKSLFNYKVVTFYWDCVELDKIYNRENFASILRDIKIGVNYDIIVKVSCSEDICGLFNMGRFRVGYEDDEYGSIDYSFVDEMLSVYYNSILSFVDERGDVKVNSIEIYLVEAGGYINIKFFQGKLFYHLLKRSFI